MAGNSPAQTVFPYVFGNMPWWTDAELRSLLKRRIPSLGEELTVGSPLEEKVRAALVTLLAQKGVEGRVQALEPGAHDKDRSRDPGAPPPAIVFSILDPPNIVVGSLTFRNLPPEAVGHLDVATSAIEGKPYATNHLWFTAMQLHDALHGAGFLLADAPTFKAGLPVKQGDRYLVPLVATVAFGPLFHIGSISVNGGPLLQGDALKPYLTIKPGDIATSEFFGPMRQMCEGLRSVYVQAGYPDAHIDDRTSQDTEHATVSHIISIWTGAQHRP